MSKYTEAAQAVYTDTQTALQTVYDALNHGQKQKILKDEAVSALFTHYGVNTGDVEE